MNELKARIVHAYFRNNELVVWKTELYGFGTQELRRRSLRRFLLYMASAPSGDTTTIVPEYFLGPRQG
jgi:hypothetical protein